MKLTSIKALFSTSSFIQYSSTVTTSKGAAKLGVFLAIAGLLITLGMANFTINKYETHLATADKVLLELAPVDPRSMIQGDYMALDYAISGQIIEAIKTKAVAEGNEGLVNNFYDLSQDGFAVINKDAQGIGHFERLAESSEASEIDLAADELLLYYRIRQGQPKLATNAFFFQEGHAAAFEQAKYGLFRINDQGQPLLTNMVDAQMQIINPTQDLESHTNNGQ